jgi:DNA-binding MarR family transcriptional regulator
MKERIYTAGQLQIGVKHKLNFRTLEVFTGVLCMIGRNEKVEEGDVIAYLSGEMPAFTAIRHIPNLVALGLINRQRNDEGGYVVTLTPAGSECMEILRETKGMYRQIGRKEHMGVTSQLFEYPSAMSGLSKFYFKRL